MHTAVFRFPLVSTYVRIIRLQVLTRFVLYCMSGGCISRLASCISLELDTCSLDMFKQECSLYGSDVGDS